MTLALTFATPLLLVGLLAAAIPWLLHLLSSVRAQDLQFSTLRFLKLSMEKTARRRRIQHWLLLLVRSALLALLCLAVAEPISSATGGWLGTSGGSAVLVLDNSFSMAVRDGQTSRLERARNQAGALVSGDDKPALAALLPATGSSAGQLSAHMESVRHGIAHTAVSYGPASLAQRVEQAIDMLSKQSTSRKVVYILTDMQRPAMEELLSSPGLLEHKDLNLMVINAATGPVNNVGITDLEIAGRPAVDAVTEFTARLVNSSAMDRVVSVGLRIDGKEVGQKSRVSLSAAGKDGQIATVRFHYAFTKAGPASGEVFIEEADDLPMDNVRRFALEIGSRVHALVVRGGRQADDPWWLDSVSRILMALQPYADKAMPWPIAPKVIEAEQFTAADLAGMDVAFLSDVPSFNAAQAAGLRDFVRKGGTAAIFLGPGVVEADYNQRLAGGAEPLLPGRLDGAIGEVSATAGAQLVNWIDTQHAYFAKLWPAMADYLTPPLTVQRYFRLVDVSKSATVIARLQGGSPMLLTHALGAGRCVLCTTTASPRWSNFSSHPLFLPVIDRMCLQAGQGAQPGACAYTADSQVRLNLRSLPVDENSPADVDVLVTLPVANGQAQPDASVKAVRTPEGYVAIFTQTALPGVYTWHVPGKEISGALAVNPPGAESKLESMPPAEFVAAMRARGFEHVYVAPTVIEANAQAAAASDGRNWWDVLAAVAIVLLVGESIVANRRRT